MWERTRLTGHCWDLSPALRLGWPPSAVSSGCASGDSGPAPQGCSSRGAERAAAARRAPPPAHPKVKINVWTRLLGPHSLSEPSPLHLNLGSHWCPAVLSGRSHNQGDAPESQGFDLRAASWRTRRVGAAGTGKAVCGHCQARTTPGSDPSGHVPSGLLLSESNSSVCPRPPHATARCPICSYCKARKGRFVAVLDSRRFSVALSISLCHRCAVSQS